MELAGRNGMAVELRLFSEPRKEQDADAQPPTVSVSLRDLLPLLTVAHRNNFLWIQDFLEDEVVVTPDLYDVLRAFQAVRPA
jgi:hypothetical protein